MIFNTKRDKFDKLLVIIADSDNEKLQNAFLDYQKEKNENNERYLKHLDSILKKAEKSDKPTLNIANIVDCTGYKWDGSESILRKCIKCYDYNLHSPIKY